MRSVQSRRPLQPYQPNYFSRNPFYSGGDANGGSTFNTSDAFSFGVWADGVEHVSVSMDRKVKTPPSIYAGLPDVVGLVVFFGAQGRVA
jgi:hypothetical protein